MDMWNWWYEYVLYKNWSFPLRISLFFVQWYDITQWLSMSILLIFNLTHFLWDSEWIIFNRRYYCNKVCLNSEKKQSEEQNDYFSQKMFLIKDLHASQYTLLLIWWQIQEKKKLVWRMSFYFFYFNPC